MARKFGLIALLAVLFILLLIFKPWRNSEDSPPRFFDRLPEADIIGKSNILDLSRSLSGTMYYYKTPMREFLSHEFLLSQSKSYGLDLITPAYFFINQDRWDLKDLGIMCMVTDSSRLRLGLDKLKVLTTLRDTIIANNKAYYDPTRSIYATYGEDWFLLYQGDDQDRIVNHILNAQMNEIPPKWRNFLNSTASIKNGTVAQLKFPELEEYGIETVSLSMTNDSTNAYFTTTIKSTDTLWFSLKKEGGPSYASQEYTKNLVNLHLDVSRLKNDPEDPFYKLITKLGRKLHFPVSTFLTAWEGDISLRQGGFHNVQEYFIESELDENFNVTEVKKSRAVRVSGYSVFLSTNSYREVLLSQLLSKGLMTTEEGKYRMLFSPPMTLTKRPGSMQLNTSNVPPKMVNDTLNQIYITHNYTRIDANIDSTDEHFIYGRIKVPLERYINQFVSKGIK
jgi:hypothetical protein